MHLRRTCNRVPDEVLMEGLLAPSGSACTTSALIAPSPAVTRTPSRQVRSSATRQLQRRRHLACTAKFITNLLLGRQETARQLEVVVGGPCHDHAYPSGSVKVKFSPNGPRGRSDAANACSSCTSQCSHKATPTPVRGGRERRGPRRARRRAANGIGEANTAPEQSEHVGGRGRIRRPAARSSRWRE